MFIEALVKSSQSFLIEFYKCKEANLLTDQTSKDRFCIKIYNSVLKMLGC